MGDPIAPSEPGTQPESATTQEVPKGATYLHYADFYREYGKIDTQSRDDSGAFRQTYLRLYGKRLVEKPSSTRPGTTYWELEDSDPERPNDYVDGYAFKISPQRASINISRDGKLLTYFPLDDQTIAQYRLKPIPFPYTEQ